MLLHRRVYERTLTTVNTPPHHSPARRSPVFRERTGGGGPAGSSSVRSGMVLDWSDFRPDSDGSHSSIDDLIAWIGACPRPSGIRVYLPPVRHRAAMLKLRHSLLALGCTVTCRMRPA